GSRWAIGALRVRRADCVGGRVGLGRGGSQGRRAAPARAYGLDPPLPLQYVSWLGSVVTGDMGNSLRTGNPVAGEILGRLPVTLELAALATVTSLLLAIPAGVVAAVSRGRIADTIVRLVALVGLSVPNFLIATMLVLFVSTQWSFFPTTGFVPVSE